MTDNSQLSTPNNPLAVSSLVSGLVAWVVGGAGSCGLFFVFPPLAICTWLLLIAGSIAAAITGHMGRSQIRESAGRPGGEQTGEGMATTGIVLGWAGIGVNVLGICMIPVLIVILALLGPVIGEVFSNIITEI